MPSHIHLMDTWDGYPKVKCYPMGPTVCIRRAGRTGKPRGYISGYIVSHHVALGQPRCEGFVCIDPEIAKPRGDGALRLWVATGSIETGDLTLSPSIECTTHREWHAHIQDGKWTGQ